VKRGGLEFDPRTGIIIEDGHDQRVVPFPSDRRALARRRWRHRLWLATPALIFVVVVIIVMIFFYSGPTQCEPYMNC